MQIPGKMRRIPNIVCACIDTYDNGVGGRLFNLYSKDPESFIDITELINQMELFFDRIEFPVASVKSRSFKRAADEAAIELIDRANRSRTFDELIAKKGDKATFLIAVSGRVNANWQGEVYWMEGQSIAGFNSDIDLMKLIELAIQKNN